MKRATASRAKSTRAKTARTKRTGARKGGRKRGSLAWVSKRPHQVVTILVADPDKAGRAACVRTIQPLRGMRVVGEAQTGLEAVSATARKKPRVVLLDLKLSSEFGATLIAILRRKSARTRVILLVGRAPESRIIEALSHGAVGYVNKTEIARFLPEALEAVSSGEAWMSRTLIPKIMDRLADFTSPEDIE